MAVPVNQTTIDRITQLKDRAQTDWQDAKNKINNLQQERDAAKTLLDNYNAILADLTVAP